MSFESDEFSFEEFESDSTLTTTSLSESHNYTKTENFSDSTNNKKSFFKDNKSYKNKFYIYCNILIIVLLLFTIVILISCLISKNVELETSLINNVDWDDFETVVPTKIHFECTGYCYCKKMGTFIINGKLKYNVFEYETTKAYEKARNKFQKTCICVDDMYYPNDIRKVECGVVHPKFQCQGWCEESREKSEFESVSDYFQLCTRFKHKKEVQFEKEFQSQANTEMDGIMKNYCFNNFKDDCENYQYYCIQEAFPSLTDLFG